MTTSQHPHRSGQPIKLVTIAKSSSRHFPSTAVARICSSFSPAACLPLWCREGWYVDINHAGGIVTRYCHQLVQPYVHIGQHVNAGDVIGISGSSGHSSGPHVHFEVHLGDHTAATATNPMPFMASAGAPLGTSAQLARP